MQLHQRQFLPYRGGAPNIHSLSGAGASRCVSLGVYSPLYAAKPLLSHSCRC